MIKNMTPPVNEGDVIDGFDTWVGKSPWSRKWHATTVSMLGESHGQRSMAGYSSWDRKQSYTTEQLTHTQSQRKHTIFCFENMLFLNLLQTQAFCFIIDLK